MPFVRARLYVPTVVRNHLRLSDERLHACLPAVVFAREGCENGEARSDCESLRASDHLDERTVQMADANTTRDAAYDQIDRFLRNNLDDSDYADYSAALERVYGVGGSVSDADLEDVWQSIIQSLAGASIREKRLAFARAVLSMRSASL